MTPVEGEYGLSKSHIASPVARDLMAVPHRRRKLVVSYPPFGPDYHDKNLSAMQRTYTHSEKFPSISFREPSTAESVSAIAFDWNNMKRIFYSSWLQAGTIIKTMDGVFANPPRGANGKVIEDESSLKKALNCAKKVRVGSGIIYLGNRDFGFAEYETFQQGLLDSAAFAGGGLARIIEHTEGPAIKLETLSSRGNYPRGVRIWGFKPTKEPTEKVLSIDSNRGIAGGELLCIYGDNWGGNEGITFGIVDGFN